MFRWLIGLARGGVAQRLREYRLVAMAATISLSFAAVATGFATFAAYALLRARQGSAIAAAIVGAAYAALAATVWIVALLRVRAGRQRRAAPPRVSPGDAGALLQALAASGSPEDQLLLIAATHLARELSPMQFLSIAVVGGFIAGRKLGKKPQ